jgi:hypothetical protein
LAARASSPLNARATAAELGYTRTTATLRLNRLVSTFAALWCPQRGDDGGIVAGAHSKLYLTDPVLAWLPSRLRAGLPTPDMTVLTETALGIALARAIDRLDEGRWVAGDTIGYARTGSGNEVDLAPVPVPSDAGTRRSVAIEAKWVDDGWRSEAKVVENKYKAGVLRDQVGAEPGPPVVGGASSPRHPAARLERVRARARVSQGGNHSKRALALTRVAGSHPLHADASVRACPDSHPQPYDEPRPSSTGCLNHKPCRILG